MTQPVPDEYHDSVQVGSQKLREGADLVMFVAEMLGNDIFELDTDEHHIVIRKRDKSLITEGA